jgi:hypothetical protein
MTRICRAKFERDDLNEAMIICGLQDGQPCGVQAHSPSPSNDWKLGMDKPDVEQGLVKQQVHETWHVSQILPHSTSLSRADCTSQTPYTGNVYSLERSESPKVTEHHAGSEARDAELKDAKQTNDSLVSPRPPHPRWDDESDPDQPYDNPYYTKPIEHKLWLPRNPCGLLDLDDTVDLSKALTSTAECGDLGPRPTGSQQGLPLSGQQSDTKPPPLPDSPASIPGTPVEATRGPHDTTPRGLSSKEEITLPPRMTSRVHSTDIEELPQPERFPSFHTPRSSAHSLLRTTGFNSPSMTRLRLESFQSEGRPYIGPSARSASIGGWLQRSASLDPRLAEVSGVLPDAQAQVELLTSVQLQPRVNVAGSSAISLTEAVTHEVISEEKAAAEERVRQEEHEAERDTREHSWWLRWFFSRRAT